MARDLTSAGRRFQADLGSGVGDRDWSFGAWIKPTGDGIKGDGSVAGTILAHGTSVSVDHHSVLQVLSNNRIAVGQDHVTTNMLTASANDTLVPDEWNCVVGVYRSGPNDGVLFVGTLSTPMAEVSYGATTAGVGAFRGPGTEWVLGGRFGGGLQQFDGLLARVFAITEDFDADQAERFRLGLLDYNVQRPPDVVLAMIWPLDEPDATADAVDIAWDREDMAPFGNPGPAEDPPIEVGWIGIGPAV